MHALTRLLHEPLLQRLLNQITPDSLLVSLASATGNSSRNFTVDTVILTESLYIFVPGVPFREHWICTIFATRCGGITVSDITTLSEFFTTIKVIIVL